MNYHHNKKTNTGLIYEFLSHEIASRLLKNDDINVVFSIIEKYFKDGVLREELNIFKTIISLKGKDENILKRSLKEIARFAQKINRKESINLKNKLIKEINSKLSPNVFNYKINNYRLYASIQLFINSAQKRNIQESIDNIGYEEEIVKLIENIKEEKNCSKTKVDNFIFISTIDNITESIKKLNKTQRDLTLRYLDSISNNNTNKFFDCVLKENINNFNLKTLNEEISNKLIVAKNKFKNCLSNKSLGDYEKLKTVLEYAELFEELRR